MEITLIDNVSKSELAEIKKMIGEAFITNELFHEFGPVKERKDLVMKYMDIYVKCVYESKSLYSSDDENAYIGLAYSDCKPMIPQLKMLVKLIFAIPYKINSATFKTALYLTERSTPEESFLKKNFSFKFRTTGVEKRIPRMR